MFCATVLVSCSVAEPVGGPSDSRAHDAVDAAPAADAEVARDASDLDGSAPDPEAFAPDVLPDEASDPTPESADAWTYPDPAVVHVVHSEPLVSATDPYSIDEPTQFRTTDVLPVLEIRSLAFVAGTLWTGTANGLFRHDPAGDRFEPVALDGLAVSDLARALLQDEFLLAAAGGAIQFIEVPSGTVRAVAEAPAIAWTTVEVAGSHAFASTDGGGLWEVTLVADEPVVSQVLDAETGPVRDIAVAADGVVWLATDRGLRTWDGHSMGSRTALDGSLLDDDVRAVFANENAVVAASANGLSFLFPDGSAPIQAGVGGLPADDLRALACAGDACLVGHRVGATHLVLSAWNPPAIASVDHYSSERWLPSNDVRAVAIDAAGALWVGTAAGLTRVEWKEHTFAEKAQAMEDLQGAHFWRLGFVPADVGTDDPWNPTDWRTWDHDNDGLWTQMQIGAWCYAYAVTHDERFYEKARKAMDMIFLQMDVPAVDFEAAGLGRGFITRSLVRDDEGAVFDDKKTQSNWHRVEFTDGHTYYWKDDTSSDETTGHFFGFPLFYDLCAKDDAERAGVAEHAAALAGYLVAHGFRLLDLDGEPTTFGHFEPERLAAAVDGLQPCLENAMQAEDAEQKIAACFGSWYGEGWLNSIEILGHLLATWHMTGDPRFYDAYETLYTVHRYREVSMPHAETVTITDPAFMNHSDHELAMLAYHTLIRYEPDPERRARFIEGLRFLYDHERGERNPLWAAFVSLLDGPETADLDAAIQSLREIPFDRRDWLVDNSHRKDALDWPDDRHGQKQFDRVYPYDEIGTVWWNSNFRKKVDGGDGRSVQGPMAWLLPYWALRYAGVIE